MDITLGVPYVATTSDLLRLAAIGIAGDFDHQLTQDLSKPLDCWGLHLLVPIQWPGRAATSGAAFVRCLAYLKLLDTTAPYRVTIDMPLDELAELPW